MSRSIRANIFRVFCNSKGGFGNPVGIVLDEKNEINSQDRQRISTKLEFSESVFINDLNTGDVSIFNPQEEVEFAGHALVGTAYFINQIIKNPIDTLKCKAGLITTRQEDNLTWIVANLENTPPWLFEQIDNTSLVENTTGTDKEHTVVWAWLDQSKGIIRARTFAPDWGIPEDEANGSGSMQLAVRLKQKLEIHHGKGSIICAQPIGTDSAEVGGSVTEDLFQEIEVGSL